MICWNLATGIGSICRDLSSSPNPIIKAWSSIDHLALGPWVHLPNPQEKKHEQASRVFHYSFFTVSKGGAFDMMLARSRVILSLQRGTNVVNIEVIMRHYKSTYFFYKCWFDLVITTTSAQLRYYQDLLLLKTTLTAAFTPSFPACCAWCQILLFPLLFACLVLQVPLTVGFGNCILSPWLDQQ